MAKSRGLFIVGGLALLTLGGCWAYSRWKSEESKSASMSPENQVERPSEAAGSQLTADEAIELLPEVAVDQSLSDLYKEFQSNNMAFGDMGAPYNQGKEALCQFVSRFAQDEAMQRDRTTLMEGASTLEYGELCLSVSEPDSTNFFAAWRELTPDKASFCKGFLGSEMIEEYVFSRKDSLSAWYLVDYFKADDIIY